VPLIDATGIHALKQFNKRCTEKGIAFLLSGVSKEVHHLLHRTGIEKFLGRAHIFSRLDEALLFAKNVSSFRAVLENPSQALPEKA
jgi:sulfate permease, SulP family